MSAFTNNLNNATGATNGLHNQQPGQLNDQRLDNQHGLQNSTTGLHNQHGVSDGLHNQHHQPGQLNENHGIAASGLQGNNLNYTGAPVSNVDKFDQQNTHGLTGNHHDGLNQHHGLGAHEQNKHIGTNGITNDPLHHGTGTNGVTNKPLPDHPHNKTGVPLSGAVGAGAAALGAHEHNKHHDNGLGHNGLGHNDGLGHNNGLGHSNGIHNNNQPTGTGFAGTAATLGSTAQPQTHTRVGDNFAHTGQPKTHGDIDDLASSRSHTNDHHHPGVATGAAGTGAAALGAHELNKHRDNGPGNNHLNKDNNITGLPLGHEHNAGGLHNTGVNHNGLGHNDGLHKDHHPGVATGAAGAGAAALGAHEHNKHNNGLNNSGVNDHGLHKDGIHNDGLHKDHHSGAAAGTAGAGATALGAHEHNKHNGVTHTGGAVNPVKGDHGYSKHSKTSDHHLDNATGVESEEPGVHDARGVRHAGVPLHEGLLPVQKDSPHQAGVEGEHDLSGSPTKVKAGDKIKGNLEKIVGKVTGNEAKVVEGDMKAHGQLNNAV